MQINNYTYIIAQCLRIVIREVPSQVGWFPNGWGQPLLEGNCAIGRQWYG